MLTTVLVAFSLNTAALPAVSNDSSCDFGARHSEAPIELEQYSFLIGNHEIHARGWDAEKNVER